MKSVAHCHICLSRWAVPACFVCLGCFLCLGLAGCSPPPRTVEVVGQVRYKGQPVEKALVVFVSNHRDDAPACGLTDADGRYYLSSFFSSHDFPRGAVPGRDYSIFIEKHARLSDNMRVLKRMAEINSEGGDVHRYVEGGEAIRDYWPDGIPEGWPLDYLPMRDVPARIKHNMEARTKLSKLEEGVSFLPRKYADWKTSGLSAVVEHSDQPQVFDFDLTGDVEEYKVLRWDEVAPGAKEATPLDRKANRSTDSLQKDS
jgi:hypothetical protein